MRENFKIILLPFSALYGGIVDVRNAGYDSGFFKVKRLPRPVVSVGNISVGGSGKTPFVMLLLEKLIAMGKKPAVLSRGYRRLTKELVIACPDKGSNPDIQMLGDEPALISMNFPDVPVAVHADRHRAGEEVLEKFGADVFLLDDGLQNRELHRDIDFILMSRSLYELRDSYLPTGNLRDSKSRLEQADVVVLTAHDAVTEARDYEELQGKYSDAPVAGVNFVASDLTDHAGTHHPLEFLGDKKAAAFCGIARPERFFENVSRLSGELISTRRFPDHHWYDEYDIDSIFEGEEDVIAITTAKDAVRIFLDEELMQLEDIGRIYSLNEKAVVESGGEHIENALRGAFGRVYA